MLKKCALGFKRIPFKIIRFEQVFFSVFSLFLILMFLTFALIMPTSKFLYFKTSLIKIFCKAK